MNSNPDYRPSPIDTSHIELPGAIESLLERLAENAHDIWAQERLSAGWAYGPQRSDSRKETPCLVAYAELPEAEKKYDRNAVRAALRAAIALGCRIDRPPGEPPHVEWLDRARSKIRGKEFLPQLEQEVQRVFAPDSATKITISDVFSGYTSDQSRKIVLGVQVSYPDSYASHIVKIGNDDKVRVDYTGWRQCLLEHNVASRVLMGLVGRRLSAGRYGVIYQDAYRLFETDGDSEGPKPLETVVDWAINDSRPYMSSVERTLAQIFSEMHRCCYNDATDDARRAATFYHDELAGGRTPSAWETWQQSAFHRRLRRDAAWLASARHKADSEALPSYLDPFDYLAWALENERTPSTLVGRAHGDLHGRNILVGVQRGEVEQPAVFDYGDMTEENLPVWDFVKLEVELKTRLLPKLFSEQAAREAVLKAGEFVRPQATPGIPELAVDEREIARRADRLEFAYQFETLLAVLTRDIVSRDDAARYLTRRQRSITGHRATDRALSVLLRLRREAAYWLGYSFPGRAALWRDEYLFAVAVYGLLTAKWQVEAPHLEWALISAGVAVAQLSDADRDLGEIVEQRRQPVPAVYPDASLPSYVIPLAWAHRLWSKGQNSQACDLLEAAIAEFPCAIPLRQEYALCLAADGRIGDAELQIDRLRPLCRIFRDHETLSRLGRILKDSGDVAWANGRPTHQDCINNGHPAWPLYRDAFTLYAEAFEFSRHYYPGVNAATLALMVGDWDSQQRLGDEVVRICRDMELGDLQERFWVCVTQAEAFLVLGKVEEAASFYVNALDCPGAKNIGMIQVAYNQLCRLSWAIGPSVVQPVLDVFQQRDVLERLEPGPLGDCGRHV